MMKLFVCKKTCLLLSLAFAYFVILEKSDRNLTTINKENLPNNENELFSSIVFLLLRHKFLLTIQKIWIRIFTYIITLIQISETKFRIEPKCLKFCWTFYMKSNDFLKVNKKYQKRNGDKSFQQVPRNISNKENFLQCVIWIPVDLFYLWYPTPVWHRKVIWLLLST